MNKGLFGAAGPRIAAFVRSKRASPLMLAGLALLGILNAASVVLVLRAIVVSDELPALATSEWRPPILSASAPARSAPAISDVQTLTRPVFMKSRRPQPPKTPTDRTATRATGSPAASGLTLGGIVHFRGSPRAYIVSNGLAVGEWLSVGEKVGVWTIVEIRKLDLTLENGAQYSKLLLYPQSP